MTAEPSTELIDGDGLGELLAEICASQEESQRFFSGVFAYLDSLSEEFARRQQAWESDRERTEAELQDRAAQLEAERAAIAAEREEARKEIEQRQEQLEQERVQVAAASADGDEQLQQSLEEAERERAALRTALEAAQTQNEHVADELDRTRTELAESRAEIEGLRDGRANGRADAAPPQPDRELQEQVQRMEQERTQLDHDRVFLESELEMVRNRAAEMAEALAQQQRQMADERQQWARELKRMRRLLETLSTRQLEHTATAARQAGGDPQPIPDAAPKARSKGDPVLGSVMAQFEMLQRDIVRRRKESAEAKSSVN